MKQTQPIISNLANWNLPNQRVLVRIDGDVPLKNGTIADDTRLKDSLPTLNLIKQNKGKIILVTHIGRPTQFDTALSAELLIPWFKAHGFSITFASDLEAAQRISQTAVTDIVLLENLRFYHEEQQHTENAHTLSFAKQLASLADFYVNEAFGTSHRQDTSMTLVPQQFTPDHRTIGLRCEQELLALSKLKDNPARPFVIILGGGKVEDKLPYIKNLLPIADYILLCPALVFTFMKAQGKEIGLSLVADKALPSARTILEMPEGESKLIFPIDYQVAQGSIDGQLNIIHVNDFKDDMVGIAIGPETIKDFTKIIDKAGTLFFNGPMGFEKRSETMKASFALLTAMANSSAYTVLGGGDTAEAAVKCGIAANIDQLSTGGGAALAYLSSVSLPGLEVFM